MTLKKTGKLIHETMVEEPTQDLDVPSKTLRKKKMMVITAMIVKMKWNNQAQFFSFREQLEVLLKMNRLNFIGLVEALKGGSSKSVGFKQNGTIIL